MCCARLLLQSCQKQLRQLLLGQLVQAEMRSLFMSSDPIAKSQPILITDVPQWFLEDPEEPIAASLIDFQEDFGNSELRKTIGRGQRPNLDSAEETKAATNFLQGELSKYVPKGAVMSMSVVPVCGQDAAGLQKEMGLQNFGLRGNTAHIATEKNMMWTARLCTKGVRAVAMVCSVSLSMHMKNQNCIGLAPKDYFRGLDEKGVMDMAKHVDVYHATVTAGDLLLTPSHYLVMDSVSTDDVYGLRFQFVLKRDTVGHTRFTTEAKKASTPGKHITKFITALGDLKD